MASRGLGAADQLGRRSGLAGSEEDSGQKGFVNVAGRLVEIIWLFFLFLEIKAVGKQIWQASTNLGKQQVGILIKEESARC